MKNFTLKSVFACAALAGMATNAQAQRITFQREVEFSEGLRATHRTVPFWADFNNDDKMDVYYSGTSGVHDWTTGGFLVKNLGNMQFDMDTEFLKETIQVPVVDENGDPVLDDNGQPVYQEQERTVGMANGLPYTAYGMGSLPLDFNQDGLVDFIYLNRGGNDTGTLKELVLVKNLGNYKFEKVEDEALSSLNFGNNNDSFNEDQEVGCISIGDYNKDGYPDLIVEGTGDNGRFVTLLKNVEGKSFEVADVFNPLAWDVETNKVGVYKKTDPTVDEDGIEIPGSYIQEPTMKAKPMSHGSVIFADLDNDGWLDIVATGYMDGDDSDAAVGVQEGGDGIRIYHNMQNGEFQDITDALCAEGETVTDVAKRWGTEDSYLQAMDYNQDGKIDLMIIGSMTGRSLKQSCLLTNVSEDGNIAFTEEAASITPFSGLTCRQATVADLNGDDIPDFVFRGWTSYEGINDWRWAINYSNGSTNNYTIDFFESGEPDEIGGHFSETMSFGDFNGDGLMDMMASDWYTNGDTVLFSRNTTDAEITLPSAPETVNATANGNKVVVTWDGTTLPMSGNEPMYNLYIKNEATGEMRMIVPANEATGYQKAYAQFGAYVLSGGEDPTYTFENLSNGNYTVGVQTVSYSYAASPFTTVANVVVNDEEDAISSVTGKAGVVVTVSDNAIVAHAAEGAAVQVYAANGMLVANGVANKPILLEGNGIYIVNVDGYVTKVLK